MSEPLTFLFLDDDSYRASAVKQAAQQFEITTGKKVLVTWVLTAADAIKAIDATAKPYDLIGLDHDLADEHYQNLKTAHVTSQEATGRVVADHIATLPLDRTSKLIAVHSMNTDGNRAMYESVLSNPAAAACSFPFNPSFYLRVFEAAFAQRES
jgi:hypothetical protein